MTKYSTDAVSLSHCVESWLYQRAIHAARGQENSMHFSRGREYTATFDLKSGITELAISPCARELVSLCREINDGILEKRSKFSRQFLLMQGVRL